jgi:MCM P-loop domain
MTTTTSADIIGATYQCLECNKKYELKFDTNKTWDQFECMKYEGVFTCEKCLVRCEPIAHFKDIDEELKQKFEREKQQQKERRKPISVLEAKRKHTGTWTIVGKIVTVSDMYVIEVAANPPENPDIEYKDAKSIQLEDIEKLDENERLDAIVYNDDIVNVIAGEIVEIKGTNELRDVIKAKKDSQIRIKRVVTNVESIKYVNRKELVIDDRDIEAFKKFASYPNLINRLCVVFAPNIIEHNDVKLGLLRSIVGGDNHGQRGGGRVNTFLVGDPGTAKSTLGQEAAMIKPNSRHVSAPHASSKTITAIAEKENETVNLKLGAIPLSRNAVVAIDEITTFSYDEQARLLDVLEEDQFPLDKHGRHWTIPAPTTIIATANPINSKWIDQQVASNDEINMIKTLLDRFQQIYPFRANMKEEQVNDFIGGVSVIRKRKPHNYNYLRKYLIHASSIEVKTVTPEAENMLNEFWKAAYLKGRLGIRMYFGLFSIAEAQAKLHLKDKVDEEIATQTMESVQLMMIQYGETIRMVITPKIVTYKKFLEILQNSTVGIEIRELCKVACKEDQQIAAYLGSNWTMDGNIKLKVVIDMLRNHNSVKQIKSNPVILQWIESVSDSSDTSDMDANVKIYSPIKNENRSVSGLSEVSDRNVQYHRQEGSVMYECPLCNHRDADPSKITEHLESWHKKKLNGGD